jgi:excisionase family DNA binding protein
MKVGVDRGYLSVAEAEMITGISQWTWRRWAYDGKITSVKLGRRLMVPMAELERCLAEGTRPRAAAISA